MAVVLVVDDEPALRDIMREVLEEAGHTVVEASDGSSGLWLFLEVRPDIALVDLFMPGKEGIETIREMRSKIPSTKIIAVSGGGRHGLMALLEVASGLGATTTLAKPFRNEELLAAAVEQALNS